MKNIILALFLVLFTSLPSLSAVRFNGTSQYVSLADVTNVDIPNGDWAYSFWVRRTSSGTVDNIYLGTGTNSQLFIYFDTDNNLYTYLQDDSSNGVFLAGTTAITDTNWHSVVLTRSSGTKTLYLDNTSQASSAGTLGALTFTSTTKFGEQGTSSGWFAGDMAEAVMWARALRADEIAALAKGYSANCFPNNQKWYYPMGGPYGYYKEMLVPITVTNSSTTTSDAQRIIYCK